MAVSAPPSVNGAISVETLVEGWPRIRADVKAVSRRIEAILQQIDPVSVNGTKVLLVSPYEFHKNRVNTDEVRRIIEDVVERQYSVRISVECLTRAELAAMPQASAPAPSAAPQSAPPQAQKPAAAQPATPQPSGPPAAEDDPAPEITTDPPPAIDTSRQIEAIKNIFDAEEERD